MLLVDPMVKCLSIQVMMFMTVLNRAEVNANWMKTFFGNSVQLLFHFTYGCLKIAWDSFEIIV